MALITNKYFQCKFWKRIPNESTTNTVDNEPIHFRAELVSDREKTYSQRLQNLITEQTRLILRTDSKQIYDWQNGEAIRGYVEFQGDIYQVQSITYDYNNQAGIGVGKFSKGHSERNAIKIITLL